MPNANTESIIEQLKKEHKNLDLAVGSSERFKLKRLPIGIPSLDSILGGGLPYGRIILFKGDYSTGKTFISQKAIVAAQKNGLTAAFIDVERTIDPAWFTLSGVDMNTLIVSQPASGEDAFDVAIALLKAGVELVIMDSAAALVPSSELEEDMEKQSVGSLARLMNRGLKRVNANNQKSIFILLNQIRSGLAAGANYPIEALPGGKGQWGYSSLILGFGKGGWIEEGVGDAKRRVGMKIRIRTEKNKTHTPLLQTELPFLFQGGVIDTSRALLELAVDAGIIENKGPYYVSKHFDNKIRGKLGVLEFLNSNPDVVDKIQNEILRGTDGKSDGDKATPEISGDTEE